MFRSRNKSRRVTTARNLFFVSYATRSLDFITAFSQNRPSRRAPTIATNWPPGELWEEHKLRKRDRWRCGELRRPLASFISTDLLRWIFLNGAFYIFPFRFPPSTKLYSFFKVLHHYKFARVQIAMHIFAQQIFAYNCEVNWERYAKQIYNNIVFNFIRYFSMLFGDISDRRSNQEIIQGTPSAMSRNFARICKRGSNLRQERHRRRKRFLHSHRSSLSSSARFVILAQGEKTMLY